MPKQPDGLTGPAAKQPPLPVSLDLPGIADIHTEAAPFVKWAGGKRSVIPALKPFFPNHIPCYWEPFLGGGAVFFAFQDRMERAVLSDANEDLVITFHVVKTNVEALILRLKAHAIEHHQDEGYFNAVRKQKLRSDIEIAARFIYLNKTCFNGLYRVNASGQFNVPKGDYKNPKICDEERLRVANEALKIAQIRVGDFTRVVEARPDDFIYCDPPYDGCFSNYQPSGFDDEDQKRLKKQADAWIDNGSRVLISNARTAMINKLYKGAAYQAHVIKAQRLISADANTRGAIEEVVISGNAQKQ